MVHHTHIYIYSQPTICISGTDNYDDGGDHFPINKMPVNGALRFGVFFSREGGVGWLVFGVFFCPSRSLGFDCIFLYNGQVT